MAYDSGFKSLSTREDTENGNNALCYMSYVVQKQNIKSNGRAYLIINNNSYNCYELFKVRSL